jgi:uncharacterized protein related to proFAR isomerase
MEVIARLLNTKENRFGKTVLTDAEAIAAVATETFHIVLLCGGINADEEAVLRERLLAIDPSLIIVQHYGGGSGLLENEILLALAQRL